ncbi:hypothetical protein BGX34_011105 [Mortierella sp. NVP85]|nr:hypothetical protein BGX34_011105 [Mortierella sp. NVP85]
MVVHMRDRNGQRYHPARIKCYPGVVLKVAVRPTPTLPSSSNDDGSSHRIEDIQPPEYSDSSTDTLITGINATMRLAPRLFLVLPYGGEPLDGKTTTISTFRVHFMCYGGEVLPHRSTGNSVDEEIPDHFHLCGHPGYELERSTEFFDRYGVYVLNLLQMLKHGFPVHGHTVASLQDLEYRGIDRVSGDDTPLTGVCKDLESSVDKMISYLLLLKACNQKTFEEHVRTGDLDDMIAGQLDLSDVVSFLKDVPENETSDTERGNPSIGGLYRGVLSESRKGSWRRRGSGADQDQSQTTEVWLCQQHYTATFGTTELKQLEEFTVSLNGGKYDLESGRLKLTLNPTKPAPVALLATLLRQTRHIHTLDLTLNWDASFQDFQVLRDCILGMEQLRELSLDCGDYTGPMTDFVNRGKRMDPLAHLLMKSKLRTIRFVRVDSLFARSMAFIAPQSTHLEEVHLDAMFEPTLHSEKLATLLRKSPGLKTLSLRCSKAGFCETIETVKNLLPTHQSFQILELSNPNFTIVSDRTEPGSLLLDPVKRGESSKNSIGDVLERYGAYLNKVVIDDQFTNDDIARLDKVTQQQDIRLKRIDIIVDWHMFKIPEMTTEGKYSLGKLLRRLYNASTASLPPSDGSISQLSMSQSSFRTALLSKPSSSTPVQEPLTITFKTQHGYMKWFPFVGEILPFLTSFELKYYDFNKSIECLNISSLHMSSSPDKAYHCHSVLKTFIFRGSYSKPTDPAIKALVRILSLCPHLETLHVIRTLYTQSQLEEFLGVLDYRRLKVLNLKGNPFGFDVRFPYNTVLPRDAVLQELTMTSSRMPQELKTTFVDEMEEWLPSCKVFV